MTYILANPLAIATRGTIARVGSTYRLANPLALATNGLITLEAGTATEGTAIVLAIGWTRQLIVTTGSSK